MLRNVAIVLLALALIAAVYVLCDTSTARNAIHDFFGAFDL